jgi:DNA-binding transcriptional ArsR family regulator
MFEVLAEPHRRRILDLLREQEQAVGDLVSALGISQPGVSKHLRVLREAGLVEVRTDAQRRVYRPLRFVSSAGDGFDGQILVAALDGTPQRPMGELWAEVHPCYVTRLGPGAATIGPPPGNDPRRAQRGSSGANA